ncbi:transketolase [Lachnospiraceae bacterium ZAX-1]
MRKAFINALNDIAFENKDIMALISDNGAIVYDKYRKELPEQYLNLGISEANMIAAAAGMSTLGLIPFIYTISNFLTMRGFEFIRNDVCLNNANVKIVGTGAGFAYSVLGATHHATEDIAVMRVLPNLTIFSPASPLETAAMTAQASQIEGPVYLRIGTGNTPEIYEESYKFLAGKGITLKNGKDVAIIGTGGILSEAIKAHAILEEIGIVARIINIHTIKPIDEQIIIKAAQETKKIFTLEEHSTIGGLGDAVGDVLLRHGCTMKHFEKIGLIDTFAKGYGSYEHLKKVNRLDAQSLVNRIAAC